MNTVKNDTVVQQLNWRYATKHFDPAHTIPETAWKTLEQALVLSPSSYGLQPWRFVVVTDPAVRQDLRAASWDQPQITESSHLVVFAARKSLGGPDIDRYVQRIAHVRKVPLQSLDGFKGMMSSSLAGRSPEAVDQWSARQAYIALGCFLTSAAMLGIDACPMEGFEPAKYDQILGLDKLGYTAVVLAAAGYRAHDDGYAKYPKVRYPAEDVILAVK
jgi:nitroreductase